MSVHFSQLLPALVFLNVTVVIVVLTSTFPKTHEFLGLQNKHFIAVISMLSAYFFYIGTQKSYFAQSNNIAEVEPAARKFLFNGIDPFDYLNDSGWQAIIHGYMDKAKVNLNRAVIYLELGIILLFISISYFLSYSHILGVISFTLTLLYIFITLRGYYQLRKELTLTVVTRTV